MLLFDFFEFIKRALLLLFASFAPRLAAALIAISRLILGPISLPRQSFSEAEVSSAELCLGSTGVVQARLSSRLTTQRVQVKAAAGLPPVTVWVVRLAC